MVQTMGKKVKAGICSVFKMHFCDSALSNDSSWPPTSPVTKDHSLICGWTWVPFHILTPKFLQSVLSAPPALIKTCTKAQSNSQVPQFMLFMSCWFWPPLKWNPSGNTKKKKKECLKFCRRYCIYWQKRQCFLYIAPWLSGLKNDCSLLSQVTKFPLLFYYPSTQTLSCSFTNAFTHSYTPPIIFPHIKRERQTHLSKLTELF